MYEYILIFVIISLIWIFFDVLHIKKSFYEAITYVIAAVILWIFVFPYWAFYERWKLINNNNNNKNTNNLSKKSFKCSECGNEVDNNAKFCPNCGVSFDDENECKNCHHINKEGAKFCEKCGEELK